MSTVVRFKNIRFQIRTDDHTPPHVHVIGPMIDGRLRFSLDTLEQMDDTNLSAKAVKQIVEQIVIHMNALRSKWEGYHGEEEI